MIAAAKTSLALGPIFGPLLDPVEIAVVRHQRIVGLFGRLTHCGWKSGKGVLLGAYAADTSGFDFGALSPPERVAKAVEWGAIIHPQYKNEFDNGMARSWQHNPSTLGCLGHWSDDARRLHYRNLCAIDGRLVLVSEHASYLSAWQEGAILSALDAVKRLHSAHDISQFPR
jgi:monoamine oxidase